MSNFFENLRLIYVGAEAEVYRAKWYGSEVVVKRRIPKPYRVAELDREIRIKRTIREAKVLHYAKRNGVPAPTVYFLDLENSIIVMSYIRGVRVRDLLDEACLEERLRICRLAGVYTAKLHEAGIQHGDLTTSNMIRAEGGRVFLVDFGLSVFTSDVEDMAVDVILFKRALASTHYKLFRECFDAFLEGYMTVRGEGSLKKVLAKVEEVERRGRYVIRG
ncbi:Kae1-associated kinase Bud32 [Candidatus Bathyarchaeota archaeon]|nr:MAG: Kae1-associated kinase Bud32 [Candidatus Bathyarchaeota archaeon]